MIKKKIKKKQGLKKTISRLKKREKSIVFTNGCFDILHAGHVHYLEEAKKLGDVLVVAVNSDGSAKRLKGKGRPVTSRDNRMKLLAALESVDFVTYFDEDDPGSIVRELEPDIIVKGSDWDEDDIIGADVVKKRGGRVATISFLKGLSTTSIIKKIKKLR